MANIRRPLSPDEIRALIPKIGAGDFTAIATVVELSPFLGGDGQVETPDGDGGGSTSGDITGDTILAKIGLATPAVYDEFQRRFMLRLQEAGGAPASPSVLLAPGAGRPVVFQPLLDLNPTGIEALASLRSGIAGAYVATIAAMEAVQAPAGPVTLGAAATLDLAQGPNFAVALNDTGAVLSLFGNWRPGVQGRITLTSDGSNTITFAGAAGVTIESLSSMTANTGAGARTHYEYWTEVSGGANRVCVRMIGGGVSAPGGSAPTLTTVTVANDATSAAYGLVGTQFTVAENAAGDTSMSYQWKLNGVDVGTDAASYTPTVGTDPTFGGGLTCTVTATNAYGSVSLESAAVTVMSAKFVMNSPASVNGTSGSTTITGYTPMAGQKFVAIAFSTSGVSPAFIANGEATGAGNHKNVAIANPSGNNRMFVNTISGLEELTDTSFSYGWTAGGAVTVTYMLYQIVGYDVSNDAAFGTDIQTASNATAGSIAINKLANQCLLAGAYRWETVTDVDMAQDQTINNVVGEGVMQKLAADNTTIAFTTDTALTLKMAAAVTFAKAA